MVGDWRLRADYDFGVSSGWKSTYLQYRGLRRQRITLGNQVAPFSFEDLTGCGVIINTSFNVRGEPIVCTPEDAYRCFMRTEMDCLVVGNYLMQKPDQPAWEKDESWMDEFELD